MNYIPADKLIAEIESRMADCKLPDGTFPTKTNAVRYEELSCLRNLITSLQQEQPDNEDIDKVAQELYEYLYELKRRNNVPTNLYDKQEIIDLWKAGIEYGRNHPKQEQPSLPSDLDEAAIDAAQLDMQDRQIMEATNDERLRYSRIFRRGFKAGAEWMAGQGLEGEQCIGHYDAEYGQVMTSCHFRAKLKDGEECLIIRKKQ